jgi:hypothetical protein
MKRPLLALAATIAMLLPAGSPVQAASCNGASHHIALSNGRATPGSGTPRTTIAFSVLYTDSAGCQPSVMVVTVAGAGTFAMSPSGSNVKAGVSYAKTVTLRAGSHAYSFTATSGSGNGEKTASFTAVRPAAVVITAPTQPPTQAPTPAPAPVPPPPAPAPVPPPVQPAPLPPPPPPPPPPATASPTPTPTSSATVSPTPSPSSAPSPTGAGPTHPISLGPLEANRGLWAPAWGGSIRPLESGLMGFEFPMLGTLIAYLSATTAGLVFFALLVRRRREGDAEPARMTLATVGASAAPKPEQVRVTPLPPMRELIPPVNPNLLSEGEEPVGPLPGEADLPRWLRPSVRAGRRTRNPGRLSGRDD